MISAAASSGLQTGIVCLLAGLSLGLLIICSSQVPQFQSSQPEVPDARSSNEQADLQGFFMSESATTKFEDSRSSADNGKKRTGLHLEESPELPGNTTSSTSQQDTSKQTDYQHRALGSALASSLISNRTRLQDGWTIRNQSLSTVLPDSKQQTQSQKSDLSLSITSSAANSTTNAMTDAASDLDMMGDTSAFDYGDEDQDEDEEPDDDVLQDGQDQDPEHKALEFLKRKQRLKKEAADVSSVNSVVSGALKKASKDSGDLAALETLMTIQEDIQRLADRQIRNLGIDSDSENQTKPVAVVTNTSTTEHKGFSIAQLTQAHAKELVETGKANYKLGKHLSRREQAFIYQMSDIMTMDLGRDAGGESINLASLTEEEANAADSEEFNSLKAYGAAEGDMVTFLHVKQGMSEKNKAELAEMRRAAPQLPLLTMDVIKNHTSNNLVLVACASWNLYDFTLNWVAHLRSLNVTNFLVGALDPRTSTGLAALGIPGFRMFPPVKSVMGLPNADEYLPREERQHKLSRQKIALAQLFTDFGFDVLFSDLDVVWLRDPLPYFSSIKKVDVMVASGEIETSAPIGDEGLEPLKPIQGDLSLSVMYIRHSKQTKLFLQAWDDRLVGQTSRTGQAVFNNLVEERMNPVTASPFHPRVAYSLRDGMSLGVLSPALFTNGQTFFVQKLHEVQNVEPYCVHVSYVFGNIEAKRHRLREAGLWKNTPKYYDRPNGFVEVELDRIEAPHKWVSEEQMIRFHTEKLTEQLSQVRAGIAIAVATERALILPKFTCFCDRIWSYKSRCRAPEYDGKVAPLPCPLDSILDIQSLLSEGQHQGPIIDFREYSFLQQPSLSKHMKDSRLLVSTARQSPLNAFLGTKGEETILINPRLSEQQLRDALTEQKSVKILCFRNAAEIFAGFSDRALGKSVAGRLAQIGGSWQYGPSSQQAYAYGVDSSIDRLIYKPI